MTRIPRRSVIAGVLAAALAAGMARAQDRRPRGQQPAERIVDPRAIQFEIGPAGNPWRIFLGLPAVPPPAAGYSAILALDGNASFPALWHLREETAAHDPVMLVGIGYPVETRNDTTRRWFDLTSPGKAPVPAQPGLRGPGERPTGGQDAFLALIADDLLPRLRRDHLVDLSALTLFGHSLGGLFVLHTLFTRPGLFARYAAADPSTWWNAGEPLREAAAFRGGVLAAGGRLDPARPLLVANSGDRRPPILDALADLPGLDLIHRPHPGETHGSLIRPAAAEALALHLGRLTP
ncbi:alpha/beta hydrolase-fold protein [Paracoccus sp. N5]|uniref:alpha/beta hydrolase n=1 Tax=Paracoccus sp. N5 TaxID=1101189 RepID=UPI00037FA58F|nr:alpha/beta hydrolase-fold protein [Paracoccus sp. N5]